MVTTWKIIGRQLKRKNNNKQNINFDKTSITNSEKKKKP